MTSRLPAIRNFRPPAHFWADNEIVDDYLPELGVYAFAVYMLLARYANNQTARCDPSIETIARKLGISAPTVKKALKTLEQQGLIVAERRSVQRGETWVNLTNLYTLQAVPKRGAGDATAAQDRCQEHAGGRAAGMVDSVPAQVGTAVTQAEQASDPGVDRQAAQVGKQLAAIKTPGSSHESSPFPPEAAGVGVVATLQQRSDTPYSEGRPTLAPRSVTENMAPDIKQREQQRVCEQAAPAAAPCPMTDAARAGGAERRVGEAVEARPAMNRDALLQAMGVRSSKARRSLDHVDVTLVAAWQQVLGDATLVAALEARGITEPVAFAVAALRDGSGPPDLATLRRWLRPPGGGTGGATASPVRNISTVSPEEWGAMPVAERKALIAAQAQRVNWRAAR